MAAADDAQNLFDHYDSYWFTHQIFKKNPHPQTQESIVETDQNLDFPDINNTNDNLLVDSIIKQQQQSDSPNSVLNLYNYSPKLETIFSGKESREILLVEEKEPVAKLKKAPGSRPKKETRKNSGKSKSLSELEFEELKGFMDLGFLFSEKDKDSKLVSIIPGLQRLGKSDCKDEQPAAVDEDHNHNNDDVVSSRPYLSEAWDDEFDNNNNNKRGSLEPLLIRIPAAFGNEVEIKDQLKCWAHSVAASVVR